MSTDYNTCSRFIGAENRVHGVLRGEKLKEGPGHLLFQRLVHHPKIIEGKNPHKFRIYGCFHQHSSAVCLLWMVNSSASCMIFSIIMENISSFLQQIMGILFGTLRRCTTLPAEAMKVGLQDGIQNGNAEITMVSGIGSSKKHVLVSCTLKAQMIIREWEYYHPRKKKEMKRSLCGKLREQNLLSFLQGKNHEKVYRIQTFSTANIKSGTVMMNISCDNPVFE